MALAFNDYRLNKLYSNCKPFLQMLCFGFTGFFFFCFSLYSNANTKGITFGNSIDKLLIAI